MIFTDIAYFIFLTISAVIYRQAGSLRNWVLIASGIAFYTYYATGFIWLFIIEAIAIYYLTHSKTRIGLISAIAIPLILLGYYKYSGFFYSIFSPTNNPFTYVALPLAISFFTFEFLHYSFDYMRGRVEKKSLTNFLAFIAFFPSMAAGPIKRFQDFNNQLEENVKSNLGDWYAGGIRILGGLVKKLVIADSLAYFSSVLASHFYVIHASGYQIWFALIALTLKVYFDFSGYSDIAIGSARLFGIRIPENFDYPLLARNIAEFWRKWHMSLYSWLNDYVFTPLSISLRNYKAWGTIAAILIVFTLSGLWHGSDWNFIAWGVFHGMAVVLYFIYRMTIKPIVSKQAWYSTGFFNAVAIVFNFLLVTVSFSLFAAPMPTAITIMQKLFFMG